MWATHAGFGKAFVHNFESIYVDRKARAVGVDPRVPEAKPEVCRGRQVVLFVTAEKVAAA